MKKYLISLVTLLLILACVIFPTTELPTIPIRTSEASTASEPIIPTSSRTLSPPTLIPNDSPECPDLVEDLPTRLDSQNELVVMVGDQLYLQSMENAERIPFLSSVPPAVGISPSASMIYYYDPSNTIHFIAEDGKEKTSIIQGRGEYSDNQAFSYVLADDRIFIERGSSSTVNPRKL